MARKSKKPVDMSSLLNSSSGTLAHIQEKTNSLAILADIVRQICPDLPDDSWKIANFERNTLIIEVKSPVWGQRLQFERNKICQQLIDVTQGKFDRIDIKVNPFTHKQIIKPSSSKVTAKNSYSISKSTASHLKDIAQHAPKGLREKLLKLASHAKK
ncbi:MAG: DciA family protein [Colwellia sp.]|nr:DciA family protein [Colwellia sp.]